MWFEHGAVVGHEVKREPNCDARRRDDPVLGTPQRIQARLQPRFRYPRAVRCANQGKGADTARPRANSHFGEE